MKIMGITFKKQYVKDISIKLLYRHTLEAVSFLGYCRTLKSDKYA